MSQNLPVLEEEMKLFREAMQQVRPIRQDKYHLKSKTKKRHYSFHQGLDLDEMATKPAQWSGSIESIHAVHGDDCLDFARSGLQHKLLKKFKKGLVPVEARIDLHRCTASEAIHKTKQFIQQAQQAHQRCLAIIHGKGRFSKTGVAILKTQLNVWLRTHSQVLAFHSAQPKDGGTGALYVLLKLSRK